MTLDVNKFILKRLDKGLTKKELSSKTGVSVCVISNFENKKSIPRPKTLKLLCNTLNINITDLFVV